MIYLSGSILTGGWPDCRDPSRAAILPDGFRPGFHEPLLRLGQTAAEALIVSTAKTAAWS